MGVLLEQATRPAAFIRRELELGDTLWRGRRGKAVRRVQEWLNLSGRRIAIDGDFGPATETAISAFQRGQGLVVDGVVGPNTHGALIAPLRAVLEPLPPEGRSLARLTHAYAERHLAQHPVEIGGQNRGPWVRLYMDGHEGTDWPWCAGFVTFVLTQATETLAVDRPIAGSVSCDTLAAQVREAGRFVSGRELRRGTHTTDDLSIASLFLVRRTPRDWIHTGLVSTFGTETFETIEGNTNDDGHREGYELCARTRGYVNMDFVRL